ncbi:MAG: class I SAM-dependent methyltransferase [bacterium]
MVSYKRIDCRLCGSKNIDLALHMSPTPLGDHYISRDELSLKEKVYPVDLYLCGDCGLAQLPDVLDATEVYGRYIYKTSDSLGLIEHFAKSVSIIMEKFTPRKGSLIVDIGSNDGSYLKLYQSKGMEVLGVEPASSIAKDASLNKVPTINEFFGTKVAESIVNDRGKASLVTSNNTFANIDNLPDFVNNVKRVMKKDGVFIFETGYVLDLLSKTIFDNIYHEHLSYFSIKPLEKFFKSMDMELFDVDRIEPKGGSIRCYVQLKGGMRHRSDSVDELLRIEKSSVIHKKKIFSDFGRRLHTIKDRIHETIKDIQTRGEKVAAYGASVGVTTALYNFDLDQRQLLFLADDNVRRQGLYSPGKHVPVLSPLELVNQHIDYTFILAWMYNDFIIGRNKKYFDSGGKFVTILQEFKII